jgi:hypothetical protein
MSYRDEFGEFFGRLNNDGDVMVLHTSSGENATRLACSYIYPIDSDFSARYDHAEGIIISVGDAKLIGLDIEI